MTVNQLRETLRAGGPLSSAEACQRLGASQPTLSRLVAQAGPSVVALGRARATRYALARPIAGVGSEIPLFRVSATGSLARVGAVHSLLNGRFWLQPPTGLGVGFDDLPYFIQDMRPQGYLGRAFPRAQRHLPVPARIADWSSDHVAIALARAGEDAIGNLVLGAESVDRLLTRVVPAPITDNAVPAAYERFVKRALAGEPVGSSAGGEQPKFEAVRVGAEGDVYHAIVKFSPPVSTPEGARWADLLRCEALAHEALANWGIRVPRVRLWLIAGRVHLEVERFDRVGATGRRGVISLGAVDDHFFGHRDRYSLAAERLARAGMLSAADARDLAFIEAFGLLIANEDMHFGNVSLHADGPHARRYALAPAHDMLPMRYRPRDEDPTPTAAFTPPTPHAGVLDVWSEAADAAAWFWSRVSRDDAISKGFRGIARRNRDAVARVSGPV